MRLGAITVTFNEENLIDACINQFDGFDIEHLILVSKEPWHGNYKMDNTWLKAKMHEASNEKVNVVVDYWPSCAEQFNYGMDLMWKTGHDWVLIVDTDEFYTPMDLGIIIEELRETKAEALCAQYMSVYWKTPDFKIIPNQNDQPIIAIKSSKRFSYIRESDCTKQMSNAEMFHLSYVRTDESAKKKIDVFEHHNEFDKENWYNEKWLKWNLEMEDLHPVVPSQFKQAVYDPVPDSIKNLLNA